MAASPLAAALMTGGNENASLLGMDPATLQALPDIQLGQSLEQQGLSTSPAYPAQALARLFQAAAGGYIKNSAMHDLSGAYSGAADEMAKIFPPNTPIGAGLRSSNPMVRMTAMQQAGKGMVMGTEPYTLEPGGTRLQGNAPIATSTAPQSPLGKTISDANNAARGGNTPGSNALQSDVTHQIMTPEGVVPPPTNVMPSRSVPTQRYNVPPQSGLGASPSAAVQPPQQQSLDQLSQAAAPSGLDAAKQALAQKFASANAAGVTNPTATGISSPAPTNTDMQPHPVQTQKFAQQGSAPGGLPADIAQAKGLQKGAEDTAAANAKYYDSLHRGLSGSAMIAAQQKQNIDLLRQVASSPNFTPGAGSDAALFLQRAAAQLHINTAGAAPREIFNQVAARILADQMSGIKSMAAETGEAGGRIFKPMLDLEEKANITPDDTLAGINSKLNLLDNAGNLMMRWGDKADDYIKTNGRLDAGFDKGLRAEIAQSRIPNAVPGARTSAPPVSPHSQSDIAAEMRRRGLLNGGQ